MQELDRRRDPEKRRMVITTGSWVRGVVVVAIAVALFLIRDLALVILASIVIASAVEPAANWAKKRGIPRLPTILGVYIILALLFVGLFYFLFLPLIGEISNFVAQFPDYASSLSGDSFLGSSLSVGDIVENLNTYLLSFSQGVLSSASFFFGGITSFVLIIILSFYLAVQEDGVGKFLKIITPWKQEKYIVNLWNRSREKIGLWMQGQLLLAAIIAVLVYLGLLLLQVPHALILAVAAGVFEIIPLFGPIIAAIPAVLIGFGMGGMPEALLIAGLFLIIQQFENQLIYPLVVKKVIGVPPMVSILALLVGGKLAGFLGILISVPLAAILMEFLSDLEKEKSARVAAVTEGIE
ncbi:AI-2E family transporter [Candidatus Parcubacteria bacterium]|nr:AI-2E family transporter [Candidatus Parcubacteria bacterium]